jgi:ubiquinone biosynthesis protein
VLLNLAMNDGAGTARAWIGMGSTTSWTNASAFAGDMSALVPQIATVSLKDLNFGVTLTAVLQQSTRRGMRTSPMISILGKSFANIEGSIRQLKPELSIIEQAVRTALEVITAGAAAPQQLRGVGRDLSNRDLSMRMTLNGSNNTPWPEPAARQRRSRSDTRHSLAVAPPLQDQMSGGLPPIRPPSVS